MNALRDSQRHHRVDLNEQGVLHISMAMFAVIMTVTGLAFWGLLHHWKGLVDTQMRLDKCTGVAAVDLKGKLQSIDSANTQIKVLRAAIAVAYATWEVGGASAAPPLQIALHAEVARQEFLRGSWMVRQGLWIAQRGCGERGDFALPLPSFSWDRPTADDIGEQAIEMDELPSEFSIEAANLPPRSAAVIRRSENGLLSTTDWQARWVEPRGLFRASFH